MNTSAPPQAAAAHELRIGDWLLDAERNRLRRADGQVVHLEPKAIEVLRQLAQRPGRVVARDELLALVWPGVVVGDDVLTQAIIKLRKALGDEVQSPRYIETITKRGYRLIATVGGDASTVTGGAEPARAITGRGRAARVWLAAAGAAGLALVLVLAAPSLFLRGGLSGPTGASPRQPADPLPLVAILPLANLSGDATREYLSDGISADMIDALGRFSGVRVMSWNAVQVLKGADAAGRPAGEELTARYLVRGGVRETEGTLRVTIELSDARKGVQLWSGRYEAQGAQVFEVQDRIVRSIVGALAVRLTDLEQQRAVQRPTDSAEAYDLVLRARALLRRYQRGANREARQLLARAQQLAPEYADAWAVAGEAEWQRAAGGWLEDPDEGVRRARELARRVIGLPDSRAQVHAHSLLAALESHAGNPEQALTHSGRAIAVNPSDTGALFRHGHALLVLGQAGEAIATFETAMRYEPRPPLAPRSHLAWAYYAAGRYGDAAAYADVVLALWPEGYEIHSVRAAAMAQLGNIEEAKRSAAAVRRLNPTFTVESAGTRLRDPQQAAKLREGLAKAGL